MDPTALVALASLFTAAVASLQGEKPLPEGPLEHGKTDREVLGAAYSARDPLGVMSFEQAVLEDPRRVFALIEQAMIRGYDEILPVDAQTRAVQLAMHLEKWDMLRQARGGRLTVQDMAAFERSFAPSFFEASMQGMPPEATAVFQARLRGMIEAFEEAQGIAARAAAVARASSQVEAQAWRDLAATLEIIEGKATGMSAGGQRRLPGYVEGLMLPATRRGGGGREDNA